MNTHLGMIIALLTASVSAADPAPRQVVREANEALQRGELDSALESYARVRDQLPDAAELDYNEAVAHYRKGEFDAARELFLKSLRTRDPQLEARAKYNLGNCAYASALRELDQVQAAVEKLSQAILHYKDAIEANPQDPDARVNIEMAQLLIKDLLDKQKQQQEQQQQEQNQQQQDQQEQQNNDSQEDGDQQQEQQQDSEDAQQSQEPQQSSEDGQPQEQQPQDGQQPQDAQPDQDQNQQGQSEEQQQQQQQQAGEAQATEGQPGQPQQMTREQAQRLLQMIRDKELQRRHQLQQQQRIRLAPVEKDW